MDDEWIIEREPNETVEEYREWVEQWKRLFPGCRARPINNSEVDRDETLIEDAKIAAIREKTNVSRVADELLRGWLSGQYQLKKPSDR